MIVYNTLSIWVSPSGDSSYKLTGYRCADVQLQPSYVARVLLCDSTLRGTDAALSRYVTFVHNSTSLHTSFQEIEFGAAIPCPEPPVVDGCPITAGPSISGIVKGGGFSGSCFTGDCVSGPWGIERSYDGRWDATNTATSGRTMSGTTIGIENTIWFDLGAEHEPFDYIRLSSGNYCE